jgi:hypothetical protein
MKKERRQLRTDKMLSLGFVDATGGDWEINNRAFNYVIVTGKDIADLSTDQWNELNATASAMSGVAAKALEDLKAEEAEEGRRKEQEEKDRIAAAEKYQSRVKRLADLNIRWVSSSNDFKHETFSSIVAVQDFIQNSTDEAFETLIGKLKDGIAAAGEQVQKVQQRKNQLELLEMVRSGNEKSTEVYVFRSNYTESHVVVFPEDLAASDEIWLQKLEGTQQAINIIKEEDAAIEKAEAERKETERQASLTDAQKAAEWLVIAHTNIPPDVQGERFKNLFGSISALYEGLESLIAEVNAAQPESGNE